MNNWKANWIWDYGEEQPENYWLCFRYNFFINEKFDKAYIWITADSRYSLYLNGKLIGNGPERSWPFEQIYDSYTDIVKTLKKGNNTIAVLVNHYGTSTSQYVQGRGGLLCQTGIYNKDKLIKEIYTNETWKTREHNGFVEKAIRINIAQGWVEIYDARKFPSNWFKEEYDDSAWDYAKIIGKFNTGPWVSLNRWPYKKFDTEKFSVKKIVSLNSVKPKGFDLTVNFSKVISKTVTDNRDKKLLGYLLTNMNSSKALKGTIKLLSKKVSKISKRLVFNGKSYAFNKENEIELEFNKGDNICLFDISGYYQTLDISFLFLIEDRIKFKVPFFTDDNHFAVIGPMEYESILNIMAIDKKLDFKNPLYAEVWNSSVSNHLNNFLKKNRSLLKPIPEKYLLYNNPHYLTKFREVIEKIDYKNNSNNTIRLFPSGTLDIELIVDFGEEISGFLGFKIDSNADVIIDIEFSESIYNRTIEYPMDTNSAVRYITKDGIQSYRINNRKGFRYAILTFRNFKNPINIIAIDALQKLYPADTEKGFSCSDLKLNKIWEISRRTLHLCMEDVYVDGPAYEQALWIGDARLEALFNYYLFGRYELTKRYNELTLQSLKRSKLPECQVPTGNPVVLTAWIFLWIISIKEYYLFSGDSNELYHSYPLILNIIDELKKNLKGNLLNIHAWNMFDWAEMDTPTEGVVTHLNAFFAESLNAAAFIAAHTGDYAKEKEFLLLAEKIKESVNQNLWDTKENAYFDSIHSDGKRSSVFSLQTNIVAYLSGFTSGKRKQYIENHLNNPPDNFIKPGSPFSYFFYLEALAKLGNFRDILKLIKEKWGEMLEHDATTCWETFKGWEDDRLTRSHCHGWSAVPVFFIGAYILGVKPVKPGFKEFIVKPETCGLDWASGYVPTPYGKIYVNWKTNNGLLDIKVKAPEQLKYQIIYPSADG